MNIGSLLRVLLMIFVFQQSVPAFAMDPEDTPSQQTILQHFKKFVRDNEKKIVKGVIITGCLFVAGLSMYDLIKLNKPNVVDIQTSYVVQWINDIAITTYYKTTQDGELPEASIADYSFLRRGS